MIGKRRCSAPSVARTSLGAQTVRRGLARPLVLNELVGDLLAFPEFTQTGPLDRADVHEGVLAAIIRVDLAKPLGRIEHFLLSRSP